MENNDCFDKNHRFCKALLCEPVDRIPVWIMRQAGRYLPEYQALRKEAKNFLTLCKTPELAMRATLQPIQRFDLDAAILFSDILTIPDALGLGLSFVEGEGPKFERSLRTLRDIKSLPNIEVEEQLSYVMEAMRLVKSALNGKVPIIGFSGTPWTLAAYMVEGGASKNFNAIMRMRYTETHGLHHLLSHLANIVTAYLNAQILAGASAIMLFDSWASLLSEPDYLEFSLIYIQKIIQGIRINHAKIPIIVFSKNGGRQIENLADTGCNAIGLDWNASLKSARTRLLMHRRELNIALQGNLDPACLYSEPKAIKNAVKTLIQESGKRDYIFNLGHGILPDVPVEHVYAMIEAVHEYGHLEATWERA